MKSATFALKHDSSGSLVYIECVVKNGKASVINAGFAKGNVVSINAVLEVLASAEQYYRYA